MSSLPPFKDKVNSSVLQHLLATLAEPPFSLPEIGKDPNESPLLQWGMRPIASFFIK